MWTIVGSTDINTLTFTHTGITGTDDVQYKLEATSNVGDGAFSPRNTFILASTPTISNAPVMVMQSKSSITVSWSLTSNGGSPLLGYKLYQTNVTTGGEQLIYDGSTIPTISSFTSKGLTAGYVYQYRVSAINRVGEGQLSPLSTKIKAANVPSKPSAPYYVSSTSSTIIIQWNDVADNGGALITQFNIYTDDGSLSTITFDLIGSTSSLFYTLDNAIDTQYITGNLYRFRVSAVNEIGEGPASNEVRIGLGSLPGKPSAPLVDLTKQTMSSVYVYWNALTGQDLTVLGYRLYMSQDGQGNNQLIYDGSQNADTRAINVTGLTTGSSYTFFITAINFNGVSQSSDELIQIVCIAPYQISSPYYMDSTQTSLTVGWSAPDYNGGCPIYTYALMRNDADGLAPSIQVDPSIINNKPYLNSYDVTGLTQLGLPYLFSIRAWNDIGYVESSATSIILAAVPDTPTVVPYQIYSKTTGT